MRCSARLVSKQFGTPTTTAPKRKRQTPKTRPAEEPSPLLALPAELRNTIYRHTLTTEGAVHVGLNGFAEPGLLSTCKQIRQEASIIFYTENEFRVPLHDYNARSCIKWEEKLVKFLEGGEVSNKPRCSAAFTLTARRWENLIKWLEAFHGGLVGAHISFPSNHAMASLEHMVIGRMFVVAKNLRNQQWSTVEKIVCEQRVILGRVERSWSD